MSLDDKDGKKTDEQTDAQKEDPSKKEISEEELENVSGGCEWGADS